MNLVFIWNQGILLYYDDRWRVHITDQEIICIVHKYTGLYHWSR